MTSWVQADFSAMSETDGHGDTCGPIVIADYLHVVQGMALTTTQIDTLRTTYINAGLMNTPQYSGMTMTSIGQALERFHHVTPVKLISWGQVNFNTFHQDLINALNARQAVIMETSNAGALPGNQAGVQNHFVLAWGIQSDIGYYCANGDTLIALQLGGVVGPVWYGIGSIQACAPGAYAILPAVVLPPPPPPPLPTVPLSINGTVTAVHHVEVTYQ